MGDRVGDVLRERRAVGRGVEEDPPGAVVVDAVEHEALEPGRRGDERLVGAGRDEQRDALAAQAPGGEDDRPGRALVEPVRVVDEREHGPRLGGHAEQAEHGGGHGERVVRGGRLERERGAERAGLHRGDAVAQLEQGREQHVQPRERDVALGLVAAGAQHAQPGRLGPLGRLAQQRRLADARLADDEHGLARPGQRGGDERVDPRHLGRAPVQHPRGPYSPLRRERSRSTAFVCSCDTRDSVTPRTSPISRRVRFS